MILLYLKQRPGSDLFLPVFSPDGLFQLLGGTGNGILSRLEYLARNSNHVKITHVQSETYST